MNADDPRPEFMFKEATRPGTGIDWTMPLPMDRLEWLEHELIKSGNLAQAYDLGRLVDPTLRAEALPRAGK